jgi:non-heme chloroperoxidase
MARSFHHLTTSDGVRIAYTDEGSGRPVVLIHGFGCHTGHWAFQHDDLLNRGYRVISIDLRFHGESERPEHGQRVSRLAQDVAEVLQHENVRDAVLIGHSLGVSVVFSYLDLHGSTAVSKLVLIDQSPRIVNDRSWQWGVRRVDWASLEAQIAGEQPWGDPTREPEISPEVMEMVIAAGGIDDFDANPYRALKIDHFVADWRDVLPRIAVPTWVVTSAHSPSFPLEGMEWVAETIPHSSLTVYPDSGHCPHWNERHAFNRDLAAFLES